MWTVSVSLVRKRGACLVEGSVAFQEAVALQEAMSLVSLMQTVGLSGSRSDVLLREMVDYQRCC